MADSTSTSSALIKIAPPTVVTGVTFIFGLSLNEWVAIATLIYVGLQTGFLLKDRLKKRRKPDA